MTWSAKIISKQKLDDNKIRIVVQFTDSVLTLDKEYIVDFLVSDDNWLKRQIINEIDKLNSLDNLEKSINIGLIDLTPSPIPPEQVSKNDYFKKLNRYRALKELVELGIFTEVELGLAQLKIDIKSKYNEKFYTQDK